MGVCSLRNLTIYHLASFSIGLKKAKEKRKRKKEEKRKKKKKEDRHLCDSNTRPRRECLNWL